jgi:hypothetical protein
MKSMDHARMNEFVKILLKEAALRGELPWLTTELVDGDSFKVRGPIGRPLAIPRVLNIYRTRAAIAKEMNIDVRGYDSLLETLASSPEGEVEIVSMVDQEEYRYLVFVSRAEGKLFGILRFPVADDRNHLFN